MRITIPTALTLFRILLLPVMVVVFYAPFMGANVAAAFIFIAAAITDWLDGWIARRWNMASSSIPSPTSSWSPSRCSSSFRRIRRR